MKESLPKKRSLPYDVSDLPNHLEYFHHQMGYLPNESLRPFMSPMAFHIFETLIQGVLGDEIDSLHDKFITDTGMHWSTKSCYLSVHSKCLFVH